jgi:hypothetical protein
VDAGHGFHRFRRFLAAAKSGKSVERLIPRTNFNSEKSGKRSKTVKNGRKTVAQGFSALCRRRAEG